ncbi:efflux RND transporter periplasmic adaptor subunit [Luteolibacter flavescens]|uniref:Efflux RND transporter periplasmic adaptor subunit n=1 Tax=Luteolibacter flavescens TaxID=1859460 RepID=A0ABT3FHY4_9BACT|nr:efflux RND transporter periplasmic adaptor subunit [Luteolibacter flavescens]MCW1883171.1 efflux RND transporter periplasmic adaptor subunit [Luteolibacter flavescens]
MLLRLLIPLLILATGGFAGWRLGKPTDAPKPDPAPPQVMKTEIMELQRTDFQVNIESQGTIRAHYTTTVTSQVAGTIVKLHDRFEDGAFFKKDEILAELDPADFQVAVSAADSGVARAEAVLVQEEARAKQARLNWQDLGYDEEPSELVLRIPQLKEAKASVDAAMAELEQARRDLERTKIRAPFDGRVQQRAVGLGQSVGGSTPLGEIFATDFAEIRLPLAPRQLEFVNLPSHPGDPEVPVTLTDAIAQNNNVQWEARIVRTEGALDESSRELFAIARIDDPFGIVSGKPPLRIGQPVRASVRGKILDDVFVIPRYTMRGVNRIYLVDRQEPAILRTNIEPVWSTADLLVIKEGLEPGQWLATTRLPYAPNGAPVEVIERPIAAETPVKADAPKASGS